MTFYISWFVSGVFFYQLYKGLNLFEHGFLAVWSVVVLFCLVHETHDFFADSFVKIIIAGLLMTVLFLLMMYKEEYLSFLKNALFIRMISYSLYLVHEEIGVLLDHQVRKISAQRECTGSIDRDHSRYLFCRIEL